MPDDQREQDAVALAARLLDAITTYPGIPIATMNRRAVQLLLLGNPTILGRRANGIGSDQYALSAPNIGAGVYRVTARRLKTKWRCGCEISAESRR